MKTIGVLGGIGPQATMEFEARVHRISQRLIEPHINHGYPPMVVWYCRHAPVLITESGMPELPIRPDPRLFEAARKLGELSDFLVITSNSVHVFQAEVEKAAGRKVVSMIDATLAEIRRRGWKRVGVLGLGDPIVYTRPLTEAGITSETISGAPRAALDSSIFRVMEGRENNESAEALRAAIAELRSRSVDGIILGCTELPVLFGPSVDYDQGVINPTQMLAEAAVSAAME
jgi:aspartate racemase